MPVEFNDESNQNNVLYGRFAQSSQAPKLVTWLLKIGIVKNETQANYVLIGIAALSIILAICIPIYRNKTPEPIFKEDLSPEIQNSLLPEILESLPSRIN
jgi:hypothetical protein